MPRPTTRSSSSCPAALLRDRLQGDFLSAEFEMAASELSATLHECERLVRRSASTGRVFEPSPRPCGGRRARSTRDVFRAGSPIDRTGTGVSAEIPDAATEAQIADALAIGRGGWRVSSRSPRDPSGNGCTLAARMAKPDRSVACSKPSPRLGIGRRDRCMSWPWPTRDPCLRAEPAPSSAIPSPERATGGLRETRSHLAGNGLCSEPALAAARAQEPGRAPRPDRPDQRKGSHVRTARRIARRGRRVRGRR